MDRSVETLIEGIVNEILENLDIELVNIEFRNEGRSKILRVYIDKENGVSINDCASISRELSVLLDVNDVINSRYTLEVSSPGLRRPLKKEEDYKKFLGRQIKLKTNKMIENRKNFKGLLKNCNDGNISVETGGTLYSIPIELITKANLEIDF